MRKLCHLSPSAFTFHLKKVLSLVPPRKPRHAAGSLRVIVFVAHISSIKKWPKCKIKKRGIVYRDVISRVPDSWWILNKLVPCSHPGPIYFKVLGMLFREFSLWSFGYHWAWSHWSHNSTLLRWKLGVHRFWQRQPGLSSTKVLTPFIWVKTLGHEETEKFSKPLASQQIKPLSAMNTVYELNVFSLHYHFP